MSIFGRKHLKLVNLKTDRVIDMLSQVVYRLTARNSFRDIKEFKEPIPAINPHEVLVKIKAVALNYRDLAIANGSYPLQVKDQVVPCSDSAGEVVKIGEAVSKVQKGDYVIANFSPSHLYGPRRQSDKTQGGTVDGVLREYAAFPEQAVTVIPGSAGLSFAQMAALVCTGVTAWNALYGNIPLKPGQIVLFQGTGGVSITGLLLAKAAGAVTIITSSSNEKLEFMKEKFGPDYVINYKTTPDWAAEAKKITDGRGVDFIFENGGSGTIKQSINAIAPGGIIAMIGFLSPACQEDMPDVASMTLAKGCIIRGILVGPKQLLDDLVAFVANKNIYLPVDKTFGFRSDEVQAAFEYLESGGHVGKVCIAVS